MMALSSSARQASSSPDHLLAQLKLPDIFRLGADVFVARKFGHATRRRGFFDVVVTVSFWNFWTSSHREKLQIR